MDKQLSILVPVYNEAENVVPLTQEVRAAIAGLEMDYELVFIDDGSSDATWEEIGKAHIVESRVRGLKHTRNAGQSGALWTGIRDPGWGFAERSGGFPNVARSVGSLRLCLWGAGEAE